MNGSARNRTYPACQVQDVVLTQVTVSQCNYAAFIWVIWLPFTPMEESRMLHLPIPLSPRSLTICSPLSISLGSYVIKTRSWAQLKNLWGFSGTWVSLDALNRAQHHFRGSPTVLSTTIFQIVQFCTSTVGLFEEAAVNQTTGCDLN